MAQQQQVVKTEGVEMIQVPKAQPDQIMAAPGQIMMDGEHNIPQAKWVGTFEGTLGKQPDCILNHCCPCLRIKTISEMAGRDDGATGQMSMLVVLHNFAHACITLLGRLQLNSLAAHTRPRLL